MDRLIEAAQGGDRAALEALLEQHLPGLRAFVRLRVDPRLRQRESCSDLVQSACRAALEHLGQFEYRGESSFRNWLFTAALNKIRQRREYHLADKRSPDAELATPSGVHWSRIDHTAPTGTPSEIAIAHERVEEVEAAFDELPESYREILTQSRVLGMSNREIAEATGRNEGAVRTQLSRALVRLSQLLDCGAEKPV